MKNVIYYVLIAGVVALLGFLGWKIIGSNDQPADDGTAANSIQNVNWQWVSLVDEGTPFDVPNPADYTITFNPDGTLTGKADCNTFEGTYSQANGLVITISSSTMAFCGEASLDTMYLSLLGSVVAGGPDGAGGLALETAGGAQRMTFSK